MAGTDGIARNEDMLKQEQVVSTMKRSCDPRTGTISYSGADFKAIVMLPLSKEALAYKINELKAQRQIVLDDYGYETDPVRESDLKQQIKIFTEEIDRLKRLQSNAEKFIKPIELFNVQTISISSHREKFPVRPCGRISPKSYTRGGRTIAGTMVFTIIDRQAMWELVQAGTNMYSSGVGVGGTDSGFPELNTILLDQLPPFDLTMLASNELGDTSYMSVYGMEFTNDGRTISIQDILTEGVCNFVARDFEDLRPLLNRRESLASGILGQPKTASEVVKERRREIERRDIRLNPFI